MPSSSEIGFQSMARDCKEPECGAHQTNQDVLCVQDDELCVQNVLCVQDDVLCVQGPAESSSVGNGLGDSDYSYMSKAQITPNDVADATSVCSRDFLKSRYSVWEMKIAQSDGSVGPLMLQMSSMSLKSSKFRKSSMCLKSSKFRKSTEFFKVLRVSDSNQVTCENETQDTG